MKNQILLNEPVMVEIVEAIERYSQIILADGSHLNIKWTPLKVLFCGIGVDGNPIYQIQSMPVNVLIKSGLSPYGEAEGFGLKAEETVQ